MSAFGVRVVSSTMNQVLLTFYGQTAQQLQLPTQKMGLKGRWSTMMQLEAPVARWLP
jgi:hypothetical protein